LKAFEFRQLSDAELIKRIQEEEESLGNLRFQKVISQLENPMKLQHIRRDIARMKTLLREREIKKPSQPVVASSEQEKKA
jgi:large subunit ribosomal protein L29